MLLKVFLQLAQSLCFPLGCLYFRVVAVRSSRKMTSNIVQNFADHKASFKDECASTLELKLSSFLLSLHAPFCTFRLGFQGLVIAPYFTISIYCELLLHMVASAPGPLLKSTVKECESCNMKGNHMCQPQIKEVTSGGEGCALLYVCLTGMITKDSSIATTFQSVHNLL